MSIEAQSPSHRGRVIRPRCSYALRYPVTALATTSLRSTLSYLVIANLCASVTLPLHSWRSGQLQAWFKRTPEVGVTPLDSRANSVEMSDYILM